jgi:hypothetical protein
MQSFADPGRTAQTADLRWRLFAYCAVGSTRSSPSVTTFRKIAGQQGWRGLPASAAVTECLRRSPASRLWRRRIDVPPGGQPRHATQRTVDKLRIQRVVTVAAAFLFAALVPASVMAALWHAAKIASLVFAFTFAIALYHAVFLGLPLFLVFRLKGWINVMSCVVSGFAVGAVPAGLLTWPMQHPELHMSASVDGVPTIINGVITASGWVNYVKPIFYFGSFGALGGFAFSVALISAGIFGPRGGSTGHTRASGPASYSKHR